MTDYRRLTESVIDRLVSIASGLRATAGVLIAASAIGAVLGGVGLHLFGAHPMLATAIASLLAVPIIGLWRLRCGLSSLVDVAGLLRSLPGGLSGTRERLGDLVSDLPTRPRNPRAFGRTLRALSQAVQYLEASSPTSLGAAGLAVTPAALLAGLLAAFWATGAVLVGATIFFLALLTP